MYPCINTAVPGSTEMGDGQFHSPSSIAIDDNLNSNIRGIYVADSENSRIEKFDTNGHFITKWGRYGIGDGEFKIASGIAVDPLGNFVYVADSGYNRVEEFDSNGHFITTWGSLGSDNGQFDVPLKVAVNPLDSSVYVADSRNARIQKFTANGTFVTTWGSGCNILNGAGCIVPNANLSRGDGQFNDVGGISFDPTGSFVYVADSDNNRIQVFAANDIFNIKKINLIQNALPLVFPSSPQLVISKNNVFVAWQMYDATKNNVYILLKRSTDGGSSFTSALNLANNTRSGYQIAVSGNNVYVVWQQLQGSDLFFRRSTDGGVKFGNATALSNSTEFPDYNYIPQLTAIGNNVYVAWVQRVHNTPLLQVLFRSSNNDGGSFGNTVSVYKSTLQYMYPNLAASGNNVYLGWNRDGDACLLASRNNVYVAWTESTQGNDSLSLSRSIDNGSSFEHPIILNKYINIRHGNPDTNSIFYSRSEDNGSSFSIPINLTDTSGVSDSPHIYVSGNNVYLLWQENSFPLKNSFLFNKNAIFLAISKNRGSLFDKPMNVSGVKPCCSNNRYSNPQLFTSSRNVYVTWLDAKNGTSWYGIYFRKSMNNGIDFGSIINLNNGNGYTISMQLKGSVNNVYIVWDTFQTPLGPGLNTRPQGLFFSRVEN
ncbi:MAG: 6-bladed beta-propeller [Candidatus Nitrosopolaris sp.]|jgi:DNA-binding beta-propeller fold protein YncE